MNPSAPTAKDFKGIYIDKPFSMGSGLTRWWYTVVVVDSSWVREERGEEQVRDSPRKYSSEIPT